MPDADDFDVEYFRALLKGNSPEKGSARPPAQPPPEAKKSARPASRRAGAGGKKPPGTGRKKAGRR